MKNTLTALAAAAVLAGIAAPAAAQTTQFPTFGNEVSLFGTWEDRKDPDIETTRLSARYGRYFRPQIVGTLELSRERTEVPGADSATTAFLVGAKYYFTPLRPQSIVPFVDAAIGFAMSDNGPDDSTDLAWQFGGGVSWFFTSTTSFDAGLQLFYADTDSDTKGTRIFVGMTTRF
jgi:Outer membrane protein beta-barrel domain